jgi:hypothetical protein
MLAILIVARDVEIELDILAPSNTTVFNANAD